MHKVLFTFFVIILLFLAGCSSQSEPTPVVETSIIEEEVQFEEPVIEEPIEEEIEEEPLEEIVEEEIELERKEAETETETTDTITSILSDGSYTDEGDYSSPGGRDTLEVSLTIKDGLITSLSVIALDAHRKSEEYIERFNNGVQEFVIGKRIEDLEVPSRVGGSSLTITGFNEAIEKIKNS